MDNVIGVSYFLHEKGEGHYFSVHSGYHNEFIKLGYTHKYLARSDKENSLDWVVPSITYKPDELYGLNKRNDILDTYAIINKEVTSKNYFLYIFEGNIDYWIIIALVCRITGATGHVNLMRSDLIIENIHTKNISFKFWLKFCKFISGSQVTFSVLTENMAAKLFEFSGIKFKVIPTFSGFKKEPNIKGAKIEKPEIPKVLVAAPYPSDLQKLSEVFSARPDLVNKVKVTTWVENYQDFLRFSCELHNTHMSDEEYGKLISGSKYVVLLYTNIFHVYGSSSKGYDAAVYGKKVCATKDSSASHQIKGIADHYIFNKDVLSEVIKAIENPDFYIEKSKLLPPTEADAVNFLVKENRKKGGLVSKFIGFIILGLLKSQNRTRRIFL